MTQEPDTNSERTEDNHPTLTIEYTLDSAHSEMCAQLQRAGVDVEGVIVAETQPQIEQTLHQIFQTSKYQGE